MEPQKPHQTTPQVFPRAVYTAQDKVFSAVPKPDSTAPVAPFTTVADILSESKDGKSGRGALIGTIIVILIIVILGALYFWGRVLEGRTPTVDNSTVQL